VVTGAGRRAIVGPGASEDVSFVLGCRRGCVLGNGCSPGGDARSAASLGLQLIDLYAICRRPRLEVRRNDRRRTAGGPALDRRPNLSCGSRKVGPGFTGG